MRFWIGHWDLVIGHFLNAKGAITHHPPVLLILAAFSRYDSALAWARQKAVASWGPIATSSDVFAFEDTDYYEQSMGPGLKKLFFAFENLIEAARLVEIKHQTNAWEDEYRDTNDHAEPRPLNLDPGYLTEAKLVLATTKDRDHRLYLGQGIFAEVTLHCHRGQRWTPRDWTYPDYRNSTYHEYFTRCRSYLRGASGKSEKK